MFSGFKSSEAKYTSLDGSNSNLHYPNQHVYRYVTNTLHFWREAVIVFLSIVCTILALEQTYYRPDQPEARAKVPEYQLTSSDTRWREFQWYSNIYSSSDPNDDQAVNEAWDRIIPAHGFVTVDHEWAAAHHLPDTMSLPSDNSKGVYIIDACVNPHLIR
ncbi:hypothetical protein BGW36DRAFT_354737 [Talaromyces proteolyticus]|uniref:Uncharacterized protein n=1 Tax=Talaromyces proteolyticus TaxID=1131652 RepID=A0AAD4Q4S4_9EURO|nr:uncharacterized protein BGW36DRAFT_354737 [Talaromyces proteolyticus]KAH8703310.1 hypothetical protein BGW36DRAFT_354737 [Talaromyces proteolyticus]